MQLARRKSDSSFYESFSDLIFCALVLFVALVMVLAANVGVQVESLKIVKADLVESKEKLKSAVNSHRYTGASSIPSLSLAIDVRPNSPKIYFVPREYIDSHSIPIIKETQEQALARQRNAVNAMTESIEQQRGLTEDEFKSFLKAFSYHTTFRTEWPILGIELEEVENGLKIIHVQPWSSMSSDEIGSTILQVEGKPVHTINEMHACLAALKESSTHATVLVEKNGGRIELKAKLLNHFYDGISFHMSHVAQASASGWRLVGEGLEMKISGNEVLDQIGQDQAYEQTIISTQNIIAALPLMALGGRGNEEPVTVLQMKVLATEEKRLQIGGIAFQLNEVVLLLRSIVHGNVAIEFVDENNQATSSIPVWVHTHVLNPAGYINRAPDLEAIEKWLVANQSPDSQSTQP